MRILHIVVFLLLFMSLIPILSCAAEMRRETRSFLEFRNIPYVENGGERQHLDLFLPENNERSNKKYPLLVYIHGGGWAGGSKEAIGNRVPWLIQNGYAVATINYRLTGTDIFPAQIEDCKAAIRWLRANAEKYHLDTEHVGVFGESAGGHLVALLAVTGDIKEFDVGENLDQSSAVQACCDIFGPTDFTVFLQHEGFKDEFDVASLLERFFGGKLEDKMDLARKASPMAYVKKDLPPILILQGDSDELVPYQQSVIFEEALKKAGATVELVMFKGAGHGGPDFSSPETKKKMMDFFAKYLK